MNEFKCLSILFVQYVAYLAPLKIPEKTIFRVQSTIYIYKVHLNVPFNSLLSDTQNIYIVRFQADKAFQGRNLQFPKKAKTRISERLSAIPERTKVLTVIFINIPADFQI